MTEGLGDGGRKADIQLVTKPTPPVVETQEVKIEVAEEVVPQAMGNTAPVAKPVEATAPKTDLEYLDIPAFLRKQAD